MNGRGMPAKETGGTRTPGRKNRDGDYLTSNDWKCTESPSGAHFWTETSKDHAVGLFECRYCAEERLFSTTR